MTKRIHKIGIAARLTVIVAVILAVFLVPWVVNTAKQVWFDAQDSANSDVNNRFRGIDTGTLSGRQVIEARERDIERISKYLLETEYFDTARTGIRGAGVHGHSLRLDENGLMFDMLRRQVFNKETGNVEMVRDQIGVDLDEPVVLGEPLDEETLKSKTTIYRIDGEAYKDDTEAVEVLKNIHVSRSFGAFNPVKGWD